MNKDEAIEKYMKDYHTKPYQVRCIARDSFMAGWDAVCREFKKLTFDSPMLSNQPAYPITKGDGDNGE